jgi:putative aldouronate transport system substrate-binding protein
MNKKKVISIILSAAMVLSLSACGSTSGDTATTSNDSSSSGTADTTDNSSSTSTQEAAQEENLGYTYGVETTFHSDEPVTYSMFFSDASWYPMVDQWMTDGVFAKITELTNVTLDITSIDSSDYNNKTALMINSGESAYIIPKVYDESAFVDGGAVVAVSDWVQYMPNYTKFYNDYNMEADVNQIVRADGKYYRLPGMKETALQDYTFMVRTDIFEAAGYDVHELEKDWTWDDLYDVLVGVKEYMVKEGMCKESDYIWSDLWCGSESGQGNGGNLLKLIGASYNVPSGWAVGNGMAYDADKDEWYFASTSDDYKEFVTVANKFIKGGILDPETFTQEDATANNKFYRGETAIISVNRSQYTTWLAGLDEGLGAGNYKAELVVYPKGTNNYTSENSRLECGVMIATKALNELGEEDFIKMLRFVDWLWYSNDGKTLTKWGVQGEHWDYVTDETTGLQVKALTDNWYCGGLGIAATDETKQKDLRLELGYAGGNFFYGGDNEQLTDNFIPELQDYYARVAEYREIKPLDPSYSSTEDENEQMNLWKTPLIDNVNAWTLQFVTGQKDIESDWDSYVASCEGLNSQAMVDLVNEMYARSK